MQKAVVVSFCRKINSLSQSLLLRKEVTRVTAKFEFPSFLGAGVSHAPFLLLFSTLKQMPGVLGRLEIPVGGHSVDPARSKSCCSGTALTAAATLPELCGVGGVAVEMREGNSSWAWTYEQSRVDEVW